MISRYLDKVEPLFEQIEFYDEGLDNEIASFVGRLRDCFDSLAAKYKRDDPFVQDAGPMLQDMEAQLRGFLKQTRKDVGRECEIIPIHGPRPKVKRRSKKRKVPEVEALAF